jgi:hypothetical protein
VVDRLITLEEGDLRVPLETSEAIDQFDFQLFNGTGDSLIHSEHRTFMPSIGLVLSPVSGQTTIEDDLSGRAAHKGPALAAQASTVLPHFSNRSLIGGPAKGSWRAFAENISQIVAAHLPETSEDRWFPRGIEGEVGTIAHLIGLLHGGRIERAVLVDPWFGKDALRRLVLRIGSQDINLTIVTSWTNVDPDTGIELDRFKPTEELEAALRKLHPFLNPRLTVINLTDGMRQAFHDRYLLLYAHDGTSRVYLLSNSLNKAAGDWPFCLSLLAADVGREVRSYIEGLCDGRDVAKDKSLTVTLRWSSNAL